MMSQGRRRFWKQVVLQKTETGEWWLAFDGRPLKTPSRQLLRVGTQALAEALAEEWAGQGETVDPASLPLTQLATTRQDRVGPLRKQVIEGILRYVDTDAACYRTEQDDPVFLRQAKAWDRILETVRESVGICFVCRSGVMPFSQAPDVHQALQLAIEGLDDSALTVLQCLVALCGSVVLGFVLVSGLVSVPDAFEAAFADELFQAQRWGEDPEAARRREDIRTEMMDALRFLELSRADPVASVRDTVIPRDRSCGETGGGLERGSETRRK